MCGKPGPTPVPTCTALPSISSPPALLRFPQAKELLCSRRAQRRRDEHAECQRGSRPGLHGLWGKLDPHGTIDGVVSRSHHESKAPCHRSQVSVANAPPASSTMAAPQPSTCTADSLHEPTCRCQISPAAAQTAATEGGAAVSFAQRPAPPPATCRCRRAACRVPMVWENPPQQTAGTGAPVPPPGPRPTWWHADRGGEATRDSQPSGARPPTAAPPRCAATIAEGPPGACTLSDRTGEGPDELSESELAPPQRDGGRERWQTTRAIRDVLRQM